MIDVLGPRIVEPGKIAVFARFDGVIYRHPHVFDDKIDAAVFAGRVALANRIDVSKWSTSALPSTHDSVPAGSS